MSDKILIVDDENEIADLVELYLKNENYTVFKFYTAQEALTCIETTEIDLTILDAMIPDGNGADRRANSWCGRLYYKTFPSTGTYCLCQSTAAAI